MFGSLKKKYDFHILLLLTRSTVNGCGHLRRPWWRLRWHMGIQRAPECHVPWRSLLRGELARYSGCGPMFFSLYSYYERTDSSICAGEFS